MPSSASRAFVHCLILVLPAIGIACTTTEGDSSTGGNSSAGACTVVRGADGKQVLECGDASLPLFPERMSGDAASCSVEQIDGGARWRCPDGTSIELSNDREVDAGDDVSCTVETQPDGTRTIRCKDGTSLELPPIADAGTTATTTTITDAGTTCHLEADDGVNTLVCSDGTRLELAEPSDAGVTCHIENDDGNDTLVCSDGTTLELAELTDAGTTRTCYVERTDAGNVLKCSDGVEVLLPSSVDAGEPTDTDAEVAESHPTLATTQTLEDTPACPYDDELGRRPGVLIRVGTDTDDDGVLSANEVTSRHYLCGRLTAGDPDAACNALAPLGVAPDSDPLGASRYVTVTALYGQDPGQATIELVRKDDQTAVAGTLSIQPSGSYTVVTLLPQQPLAPSTTYVATATAFGDCEKSHTWEFTTKSFGLPVADEDALVGRTYVVTIPSLDLFGLEGFALSVLGHDEPGATYSNQLALRFGTLGTATQNQCLPTADATADFSGSPRFLTEPIPTLLLPGSSGNVLVMHEAVLDIVVASDGTQLGEGTLSGTIDFEASVIEGSPGPSDLCQFAQLSLGMSCDGTSASGSLGNVSGLASESAPLVDVTTFTPRDGDADNYVSTLCGGLDCDDEDPNVFPGSPEVCGDLIDNDCDGTVDSIDVDQDGHQASTCGTGDDCDDSDSERYPGAAEYCNGIDDDCAGDADDGCTEPDGETCAAALVAPTTESSFHLTGTLASATHDIPLPGYWSTAPDRAYSITLSGGAVVTAYDTLNHVSVVLLPERCRGHYPISASYDDSLGVYAVGETSLSAGNYVLLLGGTTANADYDIVVEIVDYDVDSDGYSAPMDCDDSDPSVHPGAPEPACVSIDYNCDGNTFEGYDADGDSDPSPECGGNDCDDHDPNRRSGTYEVCDGADNDCNEIVDDVDYDGDGYYSAMCGGDDCIDEDPAVHPGGQEICFDGLDNDCNGAQDEGCF